MSDATKAVPFEPPLDVGPGQIQFVDACHPPLVAGDYRVDMRQSIKADKQAPGRWNSHPYDTALEFSVDAPRFQLQPSDTHSLYPPAEQKGAFDNGLPQVVFTRRTLPWERGLGGGAPQLGKPFPPWMALLLLQDHELAVPDSDGEDSGERRAIRPMPVLPPEDGGDCLMQPKDASVRAPSLGELPAERYGKTRCLTLDLPEPLFKALAPRLADLPWLAHVRQIDTSAKEVYAHNDKGWFSVLVGNRLPQPPSDADGSVRHQVFLISLEGWQACLDEAWQPKPDRLMRLVVLGNWAFDCTRGLNFKSRMDRLNLPADDDTPFPHPKLPDPWLRRPFDPFQDYPQDGSEPSADDVVNAAYARGYDAYQHQIRNGEKTASWYRGPLVPLQYVKPIQIQKPVRYSDQLLRYDPNTGLFDTSYAAAWQLGRMLALQNQAFALALDKVRRRLRAQAAQRLRDIELAHQTSGMAAAGQDLDDGLIERLKHLDFGKAVPE